MLLREYYSVVVMKENEDEERWKCDVCLSKESEDDDPLYQCDLCMVVVHPTCYRRDLYLEIFDNSEREDEPWFCARCKYLVQERPSDTNKLPNCFLCPDLKGAMVDLDTKEWVHHVCVNWHNDIWFEEKDAK